MPKSENIQNKCESVSGNKGKEAIKETKQISENNSKRVNKNKTDLEEEWKNTDCGSTLDHVYSIESLTEKNRSKNKLDEAKVNQTVRTPDIIKSCKNWVISFQILDVVAP